MSLCYNPTANTITVSIIKARNLKAMDIGGTSGMNATLSPMYFCCCPSISLLLQNENEKICVFYSPLENDIKSMKAHELTFSFSKQE